MFYEEFITPSWTGGVPPAENFENLCVLRCILMTLSDAFLAPKVILSEATVHFILTIIYSKLAYC